MTVATVQQQQIHDILTPAEAAPILKLHPQTVRQLCNLPEGAAGRIPNFRPTSKDIRIPYWGLLEWVAERSGSKLPIVIASPEVPQ